SATERTRKFGPGPRFLHTAACGSCKDPRLLAVSRRPPALPPGGCRAWPGGQLRGPGFYPGTNQDGFLRNGENMEVRPAPIFFPFRSVPRGAFTARARARGLAPTEAR